MNEFEIPLLSKHTYGDAVPLPLRRLVTQEQWTSFIKKLNTKPHSRILWKAVAASFLLFFGLAFVSMLIIGRDRIGKLLIEIMCAVGFAVTIVAIQAVEWDKQIREHLATQCNEMNKTPVVESAEVVLCEGERIVVRLYNKI
jgi:uncharacterized membrane protein